MAAISPADSGFRKVRTRIISIAFLLYIIAYLDRVNIAFAAPSMSKDLGFGPEIYGLAAGLFFITYAALEIPSTMAARRFGTRLWLARIMLTWGVLAIATGFVQNEIQLFIVRFLLGAAEAGAFPILLLWVSSWIPPGYRARAIALFTASLPIAAAIGAPLSGILLELDGTMGLEGWRLLFIVEGLPALIAAIWVFRRLPTAPRNAAWPSSEEKEAVSRVLAKQEKDIAEHSLTAKSVRDAFASPRVWILGIAFMCIALGFYSLTLWQPMLINENFPDLSPWQQGLINMPPFLLAAISMYLVALRSDQRGQTRWITLLVLTTAAVAIVLIYQSGQVGYAALVVATIAIWSSASLVWVTPTKFLHDKGAASGVPLINSIAAIGGFIGPYTIGVLVARGHGLAGLAFVAGAVFIGGILYFIIATSFEAARNRKGAVESNVGS